MEAQLSVERGPGRRSSASLLDGGTCVIGRGQGVGLALDDPAVAPRHAVLTLDGRGLWITDLGAPGGTRLNDAPLPPNTLVQAFGGDALAIGATLVRVTLLGRGASTRSRAIPAAKPVDPVVPQDEFEVVRTLGEGASGVVYAARWRPHGGQWVALKVLKEEVDPTGTEFERFVREASTAARLKSPFIVATYDLRVVGGKRAYTILELVQGPSLRDLVLRGPLPVADVLRIGEHVARALAAAAEAGIVHRDVKPANIIVAPDGTAKLCDFGVAKDTESTVRTLTVSGVGLGTMAYMAPEQVGGAKHVEPSADVYALGATLYELLSGRPPFTPTSFQSLVELASLEPPPLVRPDAHPGLLALVHAMLAKDPDERPPAWKIARQLAPAGRRP